MMGCSYTLVLCNALSDVECNHFVQIVREVASYEEVQLTDA